MGGGGGALLSTNKFDGKGGGRLPMAHAATMVALLFSTPCIVSLSPSLPPVALLSTVARHGLLSGTGHRELGVRSAAATVAAAQAQQAPKTDPAEGKCPLLRLNFYAVAALNTILGRWGKKASSEWNISGEPCSGYAIDKTDWDYYPNINPFIKCDCTDSNNTVCHITKLRVTKLDVVGQIPTELQNLTHLVDLYDYSFAIDCGSKTALRGSDNTIYEADSINLGAASYYVTDLTRWGVSSVGNYFQATDGNNIISSPQHFQNVVDSELFETARMSPSSLRYYGLGLENGNYTVVLQFAEFAFPDSQTWLSLGRRVFDIYVQGKLPDGRVIAVKQLSQSSHQGTNQFVTEVATISAVQHRNLVRLHGCCIDSKTPLLVYEYLENGSLDRAIFGQNSFNLDWATRFEIILGIARGLTYLHEESSVRIVHRDIKASNILLDIDLTPKISDFGLAKLYDENQTHVSTGIAGTIGYLAPEYAMRGRLTEKADVFAFGVVMLETIAGRPNTDNSLEESKIYLFE
ncbi:hypothetical protein OsI_19214 [Oryza sativa Indica Group]|uniref:non-specific serine/threonine protein kinase n=1 Tax=Oryza sativa subsp. indica TaxID=39946 RepID=B8B035_ORYSI|nr:hypothetical protein OsI_19214 [Oryza sativa Indica Group]